MRVSIIKFSAIAFLLFQSASAMANSTQEEINQWEAQRLLMSTSEINQTLPQISNVPKASVNPKICSAPLKSAEFANVFAQLTQVLKFGFTKGLPYMSGDGFGFQSHFDWHSSVHAHWALLAIARLTGDKTLRQQILNELSLSTLKKIASALQQTPSFENPYGRAWFVLLLDEIQRATSDSSTKKFALTLREQLAKDLIAHLETSDVGSISGLHDSWIFTAFLLKTSGKFSANTSSRLNQAIDAKADEIKKLKPAGDSEGIAFLNPEAVADLVLGQSFSNHTITLQQVESDLANNSSDLQQGHRVGYLITEFWPAALASRSSQTSCNDFVTRLNELLQKPEDWAYDFERTSHWIPQFIFMSIYLSLGESAL